MVWCRVEWGGEGYSAGVARRLLQPVGFPVNGTLCSPWRPKLHHPVIKRRDPATMKTCDSAAVSSLRRQCTAFKYKFLSMHSSTANIVLRFTHYIKQRNDVISFYIILMV